MPMFRSFRPQIYTFQDLHNIGKTSYDVINGKSNFMMKTSIGNVFQDVYIYLSTSLSFLSRSSYTTFFILLFSPTLLLVV